jgi:hypothetical protein
MTGGGMICKKVIYICVPYEHKISAEITALAKSFKPRFLLSRPVETILADTFYN